jgi:hypothetical protein
MAGIGMDRNVSQARFSLRRYTVCYPVVSEMRMENVSRLFDHSKGKSSASGLRVGEIITGGRKNGENRKRLNA